MSVRYHAGMPELPEVETIRRGLARRVARRRITSFQVLRGAERMLRGVPAATLRRRLVGRRIERVGRRGKYLLLHLDGGPALVVHLRMTGSLRHRKAGAAPDAYLRALIGLDDGTEVRFIDIRKLGTLEVVDDVDSALAGLGPEPLTPQFTPDALWAALRGRRAPLKAILLDQGAVAGLGNIYADEALFLAGLHPTAPAGSLRPAERRALHVAIERVLQDGITHRGASFRDYSDADGHEGAQQYFVRVFRRTGQPCNECGTPIRRSVVRQRASHWCPRCQPARQGRRKVTGARRAAGGGGTG